MASKQKPLEIGETRPKAYAHPCNVKILSSKNADKLI
jgi:hypothetical protein